MDRNHIEMKWKLEGKVLHGDLIDFVCKQGYDLSPSTPLSELSVQCNRGEVKYPLCLRKGKTIVLSDHFHVATWVQGLRLRAAHHQHLLFYKVGNDLINFQSTHTFK